MDKDAGRMRRWVRDFGWPVVRSVVRSWRDDRLPGLAAEIAFFAVLSLIPAMLAILAALGSLDFLLRSDIAANAREQILSFLGSVLTERADTTVEAVRDIFQQDNSGLVSFATLGAIWALSRSLTGTIRALDVAYDLPQQESWIRTRFKALLMSAGTIVLLTLLLAVVVVGPLLGVSRVIADLFGVPHAALQIFLLLRFPLAFFLLTLWAAMIYRFGPNHDRPWTWEVPGALLSGLLWLLSSFAFSLYLRVAGGTNQIFGVLGGVLTLLVWLYLLGLSLLLGAELNAEVGRLKKRPQRAQE